MMPFSLLRLKSLLLRMASTQMMCVHACIYELLSLNVGVRNVAPIIHSVLRNIAHKATIIWFNVSDDSRESYCHVFSGSSMDTLETLKEILDDIDSVQLSLGHQAVSYKIVSKIKNTMSDRHAAEKLFNEVLQEEIVVEN